MPLDLGDDEPGRDKDTGLMSHTLYGFHQVDVLYAQPRLVDYNIGTLSFTLENNLSSEAAKLLENGCNPFIYISPNKAELLFFPEPEDPITFTGRRKKGWTRYLIAGSFDKRSTELLVSLKLVWAKSTCYVVNNSITPDTVTVDVYLHEKKVFPSLDAFLDGCGLSNNTTLNNDTHFLYQILDAAGKLPSHLSATSQASHWDENQQDKFAEDFEQFFELLHRKRPQVLPYQLQTNSLSARLRPYQKEAVRFMIHRELHPALLPGKNWFSHVEINTGSSTLFYYNHLGVLTKQISEIPAELSMCGGVLADEMGLGKTVELLALITSLTPNKTPLVADNIEENEEMDDVSDVVNELVSMVAATVDGQEGINALKRTVSKRENVICFNADLRIPLSPTKTGAVVKCTQCGTACLERRVHWSPHLSTQQEFVCPVCVTEADPIDIGATLVVVPSAIAQQWYEEIKKHVTDDVKIDVYRGVSVDGYKHPAYLAQFNVVITTYDTIARECNFKNPNERLKCLRKRKHEVQKISTTPLFSVRWWRMCLDESQMVEAVASQAASMCNALHARARWCITGTPLTRSVEDLHGLICNLNIFPLTGKFVFDRLFFFPYSYRETSSLVSFVAQFLWRTAKKHLSSNDRVHMPRVSNHLELVTLSPLEERMYFDLVENIKTKVLPILTPYANGTHLRNLSRMTIEQLSSLFSSIRLFLLTAENSSSTTRKTDRESFTPANLWKQLYKTKRVELHTRIREYVLQSNGAAGACYKREEDGVRSRGAEKYYSNAIDIFRKIKALNVAFGLPDAEIFSSSKTEEGAEEAAAGDAKKEKRFVKHFTFDAMQYIHIFRNMQWLAKMRGVGASDLMNTSCLNQETYAAAWKLFQRKETERLASDVINWQTAALADHAGSKAPPAKEWMEQLLSATECLLSEVNWKKLNSTLFSNPQIKLSFKSFGDFQQWTMDEMENQAKGTEELRALTEKTIEVLSSDVDLEEEVDEEKWRNTDAKRFKAADKKEDDKKKADLKKLFLQRHVDVLFEDAVQCDKLGVFTAHSRRSCILCALEAARREVQILPHCTKINRYLRYEALQQIEKELRRFLTTTCDDSSALPRNFRFLLEKGNEEAAASHDYFSSHISYSAKVASLSMPIYMTGLEKLNRIRELRQCTKRLDMEDSLYETALNAHKTITQAHNEVEGIYSTNASRTLALIDTSVANIKYINTLEGEREGKEAETRECPICYGEINDSWFVFPCAHFACSECYLRYERMPQQRAGNLKCTQCRQLFPKNAVLFVQARMQYEGGESVTGMDLLDDLKLPVKFNSIVRRIFRILSANPLEKILVFTSQVAGQIALEAVFKSAKIPFLSFTAGAQQHSTLATFRNDSSCRVLLMRYQLGGKGLNLTVANHVIFSDTIDDASLEQQTIGRCDRIGQKRDVHVYHMVVKDTVEERIYTMSRVHVDKKSGPHGPDEEEGEESWTVATLLHVLLGENWEQQRGLPLPLPPNRVALM